MAAAEQSTSNGAAAVQASEFEQVHAFDVERLPIARNQDDDSQADGGFRRGDHNHKQHKNLSVELAERLAKRDERQIHRVEHQLDGHENGDRKSTRLNSSHVESSYAGFCMKKKKRA